jgi:1-acyl-sn-glycerol-3-phosphate acyltransferase
VQDEKIAHGWVFRVFSAWLCTYADIVHGFEVSGLEKIADNEPVLFILPHSTHNVDIFVCLFKMQQLCGRFPRGLFHRGVMLCWGWLLRFFGGVPGKRDIAHELAKAGIHTACVPGGVEDVLHHLTGNGRTAYELCWESHNKPGELRTGVYTNYVVAY